MSKTIHPTEIRLLNLASHTAHRTPDRSQACWLEVLADAEGGGE